MTLPHRRNFLRLAAGATALPVASRAAWAQSYPSRPVRWIVGFAPGGGNDIVARLMGQWLSERLGQPVVIENRPGAATNIATGTVVRAPPDGYTLLFVSTSSAINATLYEKLNFNFIRDIAPVAGIIRIPNVMVVNPSTPAKSVPEFLAYTKSNAGKGQSGTAAGPAGVAGYEIINTRETLPLNGSIEVTATCPTGKRVIAGGYVAPSVLDTASSSRPEGDKGWLVEFKSNGGTGEASVYAICATAS